MDDNARYTKVPLKPLSDQNMEYMDFLGFKVFDSYIFLAVEIRQSFL